MRFCEPDCCADDAAAPSSSIGLFGWLLFGLSWLLVAVTLPFSLCVLLKASRRAKQNCNSILLQVVQEYERAVIFRLGRLLPGGAKVMRYISYVL